MKPKHAQAYRPRWNWRAMRGSPACIKWNMRDMQVNLEAALARTPGRSLAVQAGANLGLFPKRLAEEFDVVHTFEPDPELYAITRHNAPESNIIAHMAALGCVREPVRMNCARRDDSGRPVHEGLTYIAGAGDVPQLLLDDLQLPACDIIYLDIEGYELNALIGAERTITQFRPVIAVELNGNLNHYGHTADQLRAWLRERGYRCAVRLNSDEIFTPEAPGV